MKPLDRRWVTLATALVAVAAFVAYLTRVRDPDMFHHMAYGRDVLLHGLHGDDPFLFPMRGVVTGPASYWLGSVLIYLWASAFGDGSMAFFSALVGAATVLVLLADSRPREEGWTPRSLAVAVAVLVPTVAFGRYRSFARPEILATLFLALTMWAVRRFEDGRPRLLYALAPFSIVWANVHPSVPIGVVPLGAFVVSGLLLAALARTTRLRPPGVPSLRAVGVAALVGALALAGSLVSPSPFNPLFTALRFAATTLGLDGLGPAANPATERMLPFLKTLVLEMQPLDARALTDVLGVLVALTALGFLVAWRRLRLRELLTVGAFAFLAFRAGRFAVMAAVVAAPVTARNLAGAIEAVPAAFLRARGRALLVAALGVASVAATLLVPVPSVVVAGTSFMSGLFPVRAVDYLLAHGISGPIFDTFHFGGYLEWRTGGPVYQDGRGIIPAGEEEESIAGPQSYPLFARLDARYGFEALVVNYPAPDPASAAALAASAPLADWAADRRTWALVAFDDGGLLYLRRNGRYAALAARDEFRFARPANSITNAAPGTLPFILADLRRSVSETPDCIRCRTLLGAHAASIGAWDEALAAVGPILSRREFEVNGAVSVAAAAEEGLGQNGEAAALYRRMLRAGYDPAGDRRHLAALDFKAGALDRAWAELAPNLASGGDMADVALAVDLARSRRAPADEQRWTERLRVLQQERLALTYRDKGIAASNAGDLPTAITWYQASLGARESAEVRAILGEAYRSLGRYADALREEETAARQDPHLGPAVFGMAEAQEGLGDPAAARRSYLRLLEIEPSGLRAAKARQALARLAGR